MKTNCIFLFFLFTLNGYCQDKSAHTFTYTATDSSDMYFVVPDFDDFSVNGKEQTLFSIRDRNYFRKSYYGIIKTSIPQHTLASLSSLGNVRSTVSLYLDSEGKIFYMYFVLLKKDKQLLSDQNLYELYQNLKHWQVDMSKMEVIPEQVSWRQSQNKTDTIYYSRIRLPLILYDNPLTPSTGFTYSRLTERDRIIRAAPPNYQDLSIPIRPINGSLFSIDRPFPEITLKTIDGDTIETSSLKGKVVLYNFYNPSDPVCVAETKGLNHLYQKFLKHDVVFVSVALAADEVIRAFHAKYRPGFKATVWDEENLDQLTQMVWRFPTNVVVDANGKILLVRTGGVNKPGYMKNRMVVDISPAIRRELERLKTLKAMPEESN